MKKSNGNCFICKKAISKVAIKNHILTAHNSGEEEGYLLKAEGAYDKDFWIYFSVPIDSTLSHIDKFLRQIWCECCGHLSQFYIGRHTIGKSRKLYELAIGSKLTYKYDFGSTTEILITVVDVILRPKQKNKVLLYARNKPLIINCDLCNKPASYIHAWEEKVVCENCYEKEDEQEALLPIVNSPRCGVCGYTGDFDNWTFKH